MSQSYAKRTRVSGPPILPWSPAMRTLLMALLVSGVAHAEPARITVYKDANFRGPELAVQAAVHDLSPANFHDQISSIVVHSGAWEVCTQPAFQGDCAVLPAGSYPALPTRLNHRIESLREAPLYARNAKPGDSQDHTAALVLFSARGFMGKARELDRNAHAVVETALNAPPASLVVREGIWQACTEPGYQGVCRIFHPGRYRDIQADTQPVMSLRRLGDTK